MTQLPTRPANRTPADDFIEDLNEILWVGKSPEGLLADLQDLYLRKQQAGEDAELAGAAVWGMVRWLVKFHSPKSRLVLSLTDPINAVEFERKVAQMVGFPFTNELFFPAEPAGIREAADTLRPRMIAIERLLANATTFGDLTREALLSVAMRVPGAALRYWHQILAYEESFPSQWPFAAAWGISENLLVAFLRRQKEGEYEASERLKEKADGIYNPLLAEEKVRSKEWTPERAAQWDSEYYGPLTKRLKDIGGIARTEIDAYVSGQLLPRLARIRHALHAIHASGMQADARTRSFLSLFPDDALALLLDLQGRDGFIAELISNGRVQALLDSGDAQVLANWLEEDVVPSLRKRRTQELEDAKLGLPLVSQPVPVRHEGVPSDPSSDKQGPRATISAPPSALPGEAAAPEDAPVEKPERGDKAETLRLVIKELRVTQDNQKRMRPQMMAEMRSRGFAVEDNELRAMLSREGLTKEKGGRR